MAEPARLEYDLPEIDISDLVTEDDEPVDNLLSERQQALLADVLEASWPTERSFITMVNVGLFYSLTQPAYVPDFLLSMDIVAPPNLSEKKHRSYFLWEYGKRPDLVVEVVSNIDRHEERKLTGTPASASRITSFTILKNGSATGWSELMNCMAAHTLNS